MVSIRSLPLIVVVLLLLSPATPASGHMSEFSIEGISFPCAEGVQFPCTEADYDSISGTISCTAGERYLLVAKVVDSPSYEGKGRVKGTCTGDAQDWLVELTVEDGVGDAACPLRISAKAHTKVGGTGHDEDRHTWADC